MTGQFRSLLRRVVKSPAFTSVTILTLALGIGANTAIFSVLNGILLKPLPFSESDRLAGIWMSAPGINIPELNASPSQLFLFGEESKTFDHMSLWAVDRVAINAGGEPEELDALDVTHGLLNALRVNPALGRSFRKEDDLPASPKVTMISHGYWQRRFGGDPGVIGRSLIVDSEPREIIGVLPRDFRFLNQQAQLLLPLRFDRSKVFLGNFSFQGLARLKPGVTWQQANADVARMIPILMRAFPLPPGFSAQMFESAKLTPNVKPLKDEVVGDVGTLLWVLMATIGIVLLIACANVANLMLVRAEGRQHELSIRAALGATRGELARELLGESLLLGLIGGAVGLGLAYAGLRVLLANAPANLPRVEEITMDPVVFLFGVGVSLAAGLLFGLIPVFKYAGPQTAHALRSGGSRNASASRERHRTRSVLVVVQVALALVLLVGSGLMIQTFRALLSVKPGFTNPEQVLTLSFGIPDAQEKSNDRVLEMYREMQRKIAAIPGVTSVSWGGSITMDGNRSFDPIFAEDRSYQDGQLPPVRAFKHVAPGLFGTLGNPILAGRDFAWTDIKDRTPVIILSENLAKELWGSAQNAIGKRVRESPKGSWREVVGVVGDERHHGMSEEAPKIAHWPVMVKDVWDEKENFVRYGKFAVRSSRAGTQSFAEEVRQAMWSVSPNMPVARVRTLKEIQDRSMARTSFTLVLLAIAGAMALLLGIVGIYGVISYSVAQRTREIGIRTALGATSASVERMFLNHGLALAAFGIALGVVASLVLSKWMASLLYGVSPRDAGTFVAVPLFLVAAAAAASYLPARRAARVDPSTALRTE